MPRVAEVKIYCFGRVRLGGPGLQTISKFRPICEYDFIGLKAEKRSVDPMHVRWFILQDDEGVRDGDVPTE